MRNGMRKAAVALIALAMVASLFALAACAGKAQGGPDGLDAAVEQAPEAPIGSDGVASEEEASIEGAEPSGADGPVADPSEAQASGSVACRTEAGATEAAARTGDVEQARGASQAAPAQGQGHSHDWRPITEPRDIVDVEAWEETAYKTVECTICSVCGEDVTNGDSQGRSILQHGKAHALAGQGGGTHSSTKKVPNGVVKHPAQTHTEHVTVRWQCAGCGAQKAA